MKAAPADTQFRVANVEEWKANVNVTVEALVGAARPQPPFSPTGSSPLRLIPKKVLPSKNSPTSPVPVFQSH